MTPNNSHQVHYLRQPFQRRQCAAEFGVTRAVTSADLGKLVKMGLAEKIGAGRSTRYRLKGLVQSSSNRQVKSVNRKVKEKTA